MIGRPFSPSRSARRASLFVVLLLVQSLVLVKPEIIDLGLNMLIDASSDEVHFVRGFLKAPASIDLSNVRWITNEELVFDFDEGEYGDDMTFSIDDDIFGDDDEFEIDDDDDAFEDTSAPKEVPDVLVEPEDDTEDNESINVEDSEGDISEIEEEIPEDPTLPSETEVEEEKGEEEEDVDSEGTSETPESDVVGGYDEEDSATTEGEEDAEVDIVEDEEAENIDAEEDENESDIDEAIETEEETTNVDEENIDDEPESASIPEKDTEDEDAEGEPVKESTGMPEENDEGNDEDANVEDNADVDEEEKTAEEEPSPETLPEDTNDEGVDEVEDIEGIDEDEELDENGGNRTLGFTAFTGSHSATDQIMDIIVFAVPNDCKKDSSGTCDWVALGVGAYDDEMVGEMSYCCSRDTAERNICDASEIGTMMIDHNVFDGDHRTISVPNGPLQDFEMDDPIFKVEKSGDYVMVIANCNDDGFGVITLGSMEWKSVGGYLPGEMADFMLFLDAMSAVYLVLGVWYFYGMKTYQDGAIPIQRYILATIILGFLAHSFKSIDFVYWNIEGTRSNYVMYTGLAFGILFQASLRCLGVMVAMGWGVVRDSLGMTLCKIIILGLMYAGASLLRELFEAAARPTNLVSSTEEEELVDLVLVLSLVIFVINIIFYVWILKALSRTTEYLKNMNQTSKLRRHLRLRCLIITSLVLITVLTAVNATQTVARILPAVVPDAQFQPFLTVDQEWILKAVGYLNILFILFGVAILWRPNPEAKDYAMQMQIPSGPDDENDLELSCVVPSADDMDTGEGYKIESAIST
eukprot:CAMPEP_0116144828 /NCGR_PEP_ID=MMETSP0329-20121206/16235_1 /TAXON_ID=697910 /ORGANISM="Pseudo-nitzschia arenysensis, Strain B593" /LENGTH=808 /DNA_ID=CAMNT_0003640327 /DNA_START=108 /DNA_END=2534 /DNA_ORIENTATION=-